MTTGGEDRAVTLAHSVAMPLVGFGTWQVRGRHGYEALRRALDVGYRLVDTATMYGNEVIPKSTTPQRIQSNFDIFGFSLSADEIARIDALSARR